MGRRKKFKTDEERHDARKQACRAYYARSVHLLSLPFCMLSSPSRNAEREKEKARSRWQARQEARRRAKAADVVEQPVLPHTTTVRSAVTSRNAT